MTHTASRKELRNKNISPHSNLPRPVQSSPQGSTYVVTGRGPQNLVLIHGVGLNHRVWQPQIEYFSDSFQVVSYDMLGHGGSPMPDINPDLHDYVRQVDELMACLQLDSVYLAGHSMGALVALAYALQHPEKVIRLVALNAVFQRSRAQRHAVLARAESILEHGQVENVEQALERWFGAARRMDERVDRVRRWLNQADPAGYGRSYRLFALSDTALQGRLEHLAMPVLYMTGENDPNSTPAMSRVMAKCTPRGSVSIIAGAAHMMAYINAAAVNTVIERFFSA